MSDTILEASALKKHFEVGGGLFRSAHVVRAVDGVTFEVARGETFAIVGESGCGKSTLARVLMRLEEPTEGSVLFDGHDTSKIRDRGLVELRRDVQFIFQDPFGSLNPRMSVGKIVGEPIETHQPRVKSGERRKKVADLLVRVGLRPEHADRYPHEFSGGQRQRIGIARALASSPRLLIADEPVSALDVSVQAQVVNLLHDLKAEFDLTLVVIAHDLAVIRHMSDRVTVMYLGQIVEEGPTDAIFGEARHPYTLALLSAIPQPVQGRETSRLRLSGETPSPVSPPPGCRFHTRCPFARPDCSSREPVLEHVGDRQRVACHYWREIAQDSHRFAPEPEPARASGAARRFRLYEDAIEKTHPDMAAPIGETTNRRAST